MPEVFERCGKLIAERRAAPTDDLTSVLVHAELDGERLEDHEIVMGFLLLMAAGNDSTKATYCSGMRALMENPDQRRRCSRTHRWCRRRSRSHCACSLRSRTSPARPHATPSCTGSASVRARSWSCGTRRPTAMRRAFEDPDRFDVTRDAEHQAFGAGGRHFCLGTALARLELRILIEETLARYPEIEIARHPDYVESAFANQLKTLPVRLSPPPA